MSAAALLFAVTLGQNRTTPAPSSTHGPVPCDELAEYSNTYHDCVTFSNCSGTQCSLTQQLTGSTAKFWVEETCADPVMIDLNVDGSENSPLNGFRRLFSVGGDGLHAYEPNTINAAYGRNASHLHFQVCCLSFTTIIHVKGCSCMHRVHSTSVTIPCMFKMYR